MPLGEVEPRIHPNKPPWHGLKEVKRANGIVTFRARTGTIRASEAEVERRKG